MGQQIFVQLKDMTKAQFVIATETLTLANWG